MKLLKILSWVIFLVIAVVIGAAIFFIATFDANHYKQQITKLVNKQTGRELNIDGDLNLTFYPDIAIELGKASLSNAPGFDGKHFATVGSAAISVELLPLLKKQVKVDEVRLNKLNLNLQRKADGSSNWDDLAKTSEDSKATDVKKEPAQAVQEMMSNLSIAGVSLQDATINWNDAQSGQSLTLSPVNLKTGTFKPGTPLPVTLDLVMQQKQPAMKIAANGKTTVTLSDNKLFSLADLSLHTNITGEQIPNGVLDADISGNISGSAEKISIPDLTLIANLTGDLVPEGAVKADLNGNLSFDLNQQQLGIKGMRINSTVNGKPLAGGNLQANVTGDTRFDLAGQLLSIPNLKLDATMQGGHIKDGAANSKLAGNLSVDLGKSQLTIPDLSMSTHVKGGIVPGGSLNQQSKGNVDLNWANGAGVVNLSSLLVQLADLQLTGKQVAIHPLADKPKVSGQFSTNAFNLKHALKTLGIEPPATSNPQALSQVQTQFNLKADTEMADLQQLKIKLDKTSIDGSLGIKNFTAPSIRPQLVIDTINVDDYLAPADKAKSTGASNTNAVGNEELLPLDTLRSLNIDGSVKVGSMIVNKLKLSNVNTKIKANNGIVNIDPANASLYKGDYSGRITLDASKPTPTMQMRHELVGLRSEGLLFDLFNDKYISGDTKLVTELSSKGNTLDSLVRNLNGTTSLNFKDGTIRDSKLAEKVSLAVKAFEKEELEDGKSVVKFTGLSGDLKATNGVFKSDNLSLLSPYFNIFGEGNANLVEQTLDMQLRIGPKRDEKDKSIFAPLRIHGPFDNLKFSLDLEALVKALAKEDLEKAKLKAQEKLEQEKLKLEQKLQAEKAEQLKKLQQKADDAKAKALQSIQDKAGSKLGDALKQQLGGDKDKPAPAEGETKEEPKDLEDKLKEDVKDKLKEGLKGLF